MRRGRHRASRFALAVVVLLTAGCAPSVTRGHPETSISPRLAFGSGSANDPNRPNIVFVLTDDLSMNLISHMPHVRALARAGTSLSQYYVVDSLCCPSRTAIFTGEYPHNNGVFTNHGADGGFGAYTRNHDEQKAFVVPLHAAGYRTGFMGKYLNEYQPSDPPAPGWDDWAAAGDGYREYNYTLNENGTQRHYGHRPDDYLTDVISSRAGRFIDSAAHNKQPFMLEVATFAPHAPYVPAPRYRDAAPTVKYPRTPGYDKIPTNAPTWLAKRPPLRPHQERRIDDVYRQRVRADLAVDDLIGHLQDRLRANGVAGNTYFVFSSDNGYHQGENRLMPGKQTPYDTDIHVPLVVTGPGVPAGHTSSQFASNIDLGPTFLGLTKSRTPSTVDGVSLAPLIEGRTAADWQRAVLVEHHYPTYSVQDPDRQSASSGYPPSYTAVRTDDALYVRYENGEQEYYDTKRDPYELHNLARRGVPKNLVQAMAALKRCKGAKECQVAARVPTG